MREVQQLERPGDLGQPFLPHVQIGARGVEMGMTEQPLHHGDLDACLQQMRGEGMAQGMDAALAPQARALDGVIINALPGGIDHRLFRRARGGEEPVLRAEPPPVLPQLGEQAEREQGVTILPSLALDDANLLAGGIEMLGLEMTGLVEPQARAIDRHQKGAMFGMRAAHGEEPFQFRDSRWSTRS